MPRSLGEVGREGVAVDTLADMEDLFRGIPLDQVTTSMTVNAPAACCWPSTCAWASCRASAPDKLGGTIQADILKEYIAQKEWIFPPEPSMRLMVDMIEWCTQHMPRWHPVSISGYHIREAGATAAQELAFTLADGFAYVEACVGPGHGCRRLRAPPQLLLQRPHRLLRGDRQVPGRPPDLGARAARSLWRQEPALAADALPHADRRRVADRPAAAR